MHLRWPRFIFFQLTQALCVVVVGLASWGLKIGIDKKHFVRKSIPGATLNISDALGSGGAVTAAAGVASLLCLFLNAMLLFRPHTKETIHTVRMKEGAFVFAIIFWIATLIPATYIMATKSGVVTKPGVPAAVIAQIVQLSGQKLAYKDQVAIKSYVAVGWVALVSTIINLILVSIAARHAFANGNKTDGEQGDLFGHKHRSSVDDKATTDHASVPEHKAASSSEEVAASTDAERVHA